MLALRPRSRLLSAVLLMVLAATAVVAQQPGADPAAAAAPVRLLVKLRPNYDSAGLEAAPRRVGALMTRNALRLKEVRHIVSGIHLVQVQPRDRAESGAQALARLRADPEVEYAERDERRYPNAMPDDPLFSGQWYLQNSETSAIDAQDAWNVTSGSPGLVIADLDTGVRFDHPDLRNGAANRLLPGYNMISDPATANNSYGRGPDASDPGDWISTSDLKNSAFSGCTVANSSWHGTRVAGILGALTNNTTGVAGTTWSGWIEPVRVLGKCGGYDSDIIAGMAWAAGDHVDGVPDNPYPARIVNMSLGAVGACPDSYQQMVYQLVAQGVLVVVSAGNEGGPVDAPANCAGAIGVAGLRELGTKVGFSSLGPQIAVSAPAGNCVNTGINEPCQFSIVTTTNSGTTVPATNGYTDDYNYNIGTSFSAPLVAATAGLMLSVNGNLSTDQLIGRLQAGSQPFPLSSSAGTENCHVPADGTDLQTNECNCTTTTCGAGMLNANGAVLQALRPIAAISLPASFAPGSTVMLDGSGSAAACNATLSGFLWTVLQPSTNPPTILNAHSARASIVAPTGSGSYTLMLTVTDNQGRSDSAPVVINLNSANTAAPPTVGNDACLQAVDYTVGQSSGDGSSSTGSTGSSGSSGSSGSTTASSGSKGGGGGVDFATLMALAALLAARSYSSRCAASSQSRCARR
jgi:serine protease